MLECDACLAAWPALLPACPPHAFPPLPAPPCLQVNAFCNTDDITWGTKNLDTKKDATEAKTLMKSGLAYSANQVRNWLCSSGTSTTHWEAAGNAQHYAK